MTPDDDNTGLIFDSVIFRAPFLEISFTEEPERAEGMCLVRTLVIDRDKVPDHYRSLIEALVELVEEGQVILRNPPDRIPVDP